MHETASPGTAGTARGPTGRTVGRKTVLGRAAAAHLLVAVVWVACRAPAALAAAAVPSGEARAVTVQVTPQEVVAGAFVWVVVNAPPGGLSGEFAGTSFRFYRAPDGRAVALVAASYLLSPGRHWVVVRRAEEEVGREAVTVRARPFPVQRIFVSTPKEALIRSEDPQLVARREREAEEVHEARAHPSPRPLWDGSFIWPLQGSIRITSEYGLLREVNGQAAGRHSGLDLAAPEGTPVRATSAGRVVLARNHLVTGNTVIIDHGWGLFTSYLHLSRLEVHEGQAVRRGQVIGSVGSTGFATGPHLHWAAWLPGGFIDPRVLLKGRLWPPEFTSAAS